MQMRMVGAARVLALSDGRLIFDPAQQFPGMPVELLAAHGGIENGRWVAPLTTYVVTIGGKTVVVDTGLGPSLGRFTGETGALPAALRLAEIEFARVDAVVLTHLHPDHIGWNFSEQDGESRPTFPNAR